MFVVTSKIYVNKTKKKKIEKERKRDGEKESERDRGTIFKLEGGLYACFSSNYFWNRQIPV